MMIKIRPTMKLINAFAASSCQLIGFSFFFFFPIGLPPFYGLIIYLFRCFVNIYLHFVAKKQGKHLFRNAAPQKLMLFLCASILFQVKPVVNNRSVGKMPCMIMATRLLVIFFSSFLETRSILNQQMNNP